MIPRRLLELPAARVLPDSLYAAWVRLLCLCDEDGRLPLSGAELARLVGLSEADLTALLARLTAAEAVSIDSSGVSVSGWRTPDEERKKRQRERQRKHREKVKCDKSRDSHVTSNVTGHVTVTLPVTNDKRITRYTYSSLDSLDTKDLSLGNGKSLDTDIEDKSQKGSTASSEAVPSSYQEIVDYYHKACPGLPRVRANSKARVDAVRRLKKQMPIDDIREMLGKAGRSDFLNGKNDRGFKADFTWLLNPTNAVKVLEGRYDNRAAPPKPTGTPNRFHNFEQRNIDYDALLEDEIGLKKKKPKEIKT
jgi:hypothetical protein